MGENPITTIDTGKEGPRVNLILPWTALITSLAGIVYITYRAAQFEATVSALERTLTRLETVMVSRNELEIMRERDSNQLNRVEDHERRMRELESAVFRNGMNGNGRPR